MITNLSRNEQTIDEKWHIDIGRRIFQKWRLIHFDIIVLIDHQSDRSHIDPIPKGQLTSAHMSHNQSISGFRGNCSELKNE